MFPLHDGCCGRAYFELDSFNIQLLKEVRALIFLPIRILSLNWSQNFGILFCYNRVSVQKCWIVYVLYSNFFPEILQYDQEEGASNIAPAERVVPPKWLTNSPFTPLQENKRESTSKVSLLASMTLQLSGKFYAQECCTIYYVVIIRHSFFEKIEGGNSRTSLPPPKSEFGPQNGWIV